MQDVQLSPSFIAWAQSRDRASASGGSNGSTASEGLYSFKYHNKPASVDPSSSATVFAVPSTSTSSQSTESDTIYASFPSTKQGVGKNKGKQVEHRFVGTETQAKEVDVVLVWDEATQCWSLEPLVSSISFKPDRTPNSKAPPTPAVPSAHELQSTTRAFFDSDATNPFAFVAAQPATKSEDKPAAKRPKLSSSSSALPPPGLASLLNPASSPSANGGLPPSAAQSEDEDDDMFEEVGVGGSQPQVADVPSYLRTPGGGTAPLPDLAHVYAPPPVPPKPPSPPQPVAQPRQRSAAHPPSRPVASTQTEHSPPQLAPPKPASAPAPPRPHPSYGSKIPASYTRQLAQKAKEADEASSDSDDEYEDEDVQMRPVGANAGRPPAQGKKAAEADRTTRSSATFASAPAQPAHLGPSGKPAPPSRSTTASKSIQRVAPNISDSSSSDSSSDSDDSDSGGVPSAVRAQMSRQVNAQMAKVRSGTGTPVPPAEPTGAGQRRVDYPSIQAAQAVQQQQARWQQQVQAQQQQRAAAQAAASAAGRPAPGQVGRKGLAPPVRTAASLDPRQAEIENDIPDSSEEE
ncbi:hypothetical protein JCM10296v2_005401 [Rhodotorula toruloides]